MGVFLIIIAGHEPRKVKLRSDPSPDYWEGRRGVCVGVFQIIIAGHEPR